MNGSAIPTKKHEHERNESTKKTKATPSSKACSNQRYSLNGSQYAMPSLGQSSRTVTTGSGQMLYVPTILSDTNSTSTTATTTNSKKRSLLSQSMVELTKLSDQLLQYQKQNQSKKQKLKSSTKKKIAWVDLYRPTQFAHLLTEERQNRRVLRAIKAWDPIVFSKDPPPPPHYIQKQKQQQQQSDAQPKNQVQMMVLCGAPGVGKSTMAHVLSHHAGYRLLELSLSSDENAKERLVRALESNAISFSNHNDANNNKPNCLLLQDLEGDPNKVKPILSFLLKLLASNKLKRPIFLECHSKFTPILRPLLKYSNSTVRFFDIQPPSSPRLVSRLQSVLTHQQCCVTSTPLLYQLVSNTHADICSCLHTLQSISSNLNHKKGDLSQKLSAALNGSSTKDVRMDMPLTLTTIFSAPKNNSTSFSPQKRLSKKKKKLFDIQRVFHVVDVSANIP